MIVKYQFGGRGRKHPWSGMALTTAARPTEHGRPFAGPHGRNAVSGFTLVELLTVVAIIALLVAMLMPGIGRARVAAQGAVCRSNLRQIGQAMYGYAGDQDGLFPFFGEPEDFGWPPSDHPTPVAGRLSRGTQWDVQITPYLGINWPWGRDFPPPPELGTRPTVFYCPGGKPFNINLNYALNYVRSQSYNYNARVGGNIRNSRNLALLEDPQNTLLVVDAHRFDAHTGYQCFAATRIGRQHAGSIKVTNTTPGRFCYHRHNDTIHVLFAAAHVQARPESPAQFGGVTGFPAGIRFGNGYSLYPWP